MILRSIQTIESSLEYGHTPNAYPVYRIPGIVSLENGAVAICYECRQNADWSVIDVGFRISLDAGHTWSDRKIIVSGKGRNAVNNPVLFADGNDLHLLYCENYKRMFHTKSTDLGNTWETASEITDVFDAHYWSCIAVGPGHGLIHSDKTMIAPVWMAFNQADMFSHHPSLCTTVYSKDQGKTWKCGELIDDGLVDPSEACLCEMKNADVLMNIRNENEEHYRAVCFSKNGYTDWTAPILDTNLPDPVCFGGMCNCHDNILFVNCHSQNGRRDVTLHLSSDDAKTWKSLLIDHSGGYADVCCNKKTGSAFVFYETMDCRYLKIAEISV